MTKQNLYITTAIPYVNGKPHIGNALDYLLADIWARYHRQQGETVRFQVGTDEHGNKIALKAQETNMQPQEYVDSMVGSFKTLMGAVRADYTDFVRTSDVRHKAAVQFIWGKIQPYTYKHTYEGWYCTGCEQFYTDKEAAQHNGVCPIHQKPFERLSEENYFFKLSEFGEKIKEAIETHKMDIVPEFRKREILKLIDEGLRDISFSRPKKSLSWGIPLPFDDTQVTYVWLDALTNYITVIGYPDNKQWQDFWPADLQVVGKDILRFHAAIWPAILIALELPLPKKILAHGFINVGGTKISKSLGNEIDPIEIIDRYGVDAFRYYFSRHIPTQDDGDFTWEKFENAYNNELANELGNLVSRVAKMVLNYQSGVVGDAIKAEHDQQLYHDAMEACEFNKAMDEIWQTIRTLNQYIDTVKPWEVAKRLDSDAEAAPHLTEILAYCVGSLEQIADLLWPFLPNAAETIRKTFEGGMVRDTGGIMFPRINNYTGHKTGV